MLLPDCVWLIILPVAKLVAFVFLASSITEFNVVLLDPCCVALLCPVWLMILPIAKLVAFAPCVCSRTDCSATSGIWPTEALSVICEGLRPFSHIAGLSRNA